MNKQTYILLALSLLLTACGGTTSTLGGNSSSSSSSSTSSGSSGISRDQVSAYFAQYHCGVDFTAMGNTDSLPCYRTPDGKAECIEYYHPDARIVPVTWYGDGKPVTDVLHVSGGGGKGGGILVVTTDGKVYTGGGPEVNPIPVINSGGLMVSGGYTNSCAIVREGDKKKVWCDSDNFKPMEGLPEDFDAVQITSRWATSCALGSNGDVWCWAYATSPSKVPFSGPIKFFSDSDGDRDSQCGIKFDGTVECFGSWSPSQSLTNVVRIYGGGFSLIAADANGQGSYHRREVSVPFDVTDIAAITGGEDSIVALSTKNGDVHIVMGDGITKKIPGAKAQAAECPH